MSDIGRRQPNATPWVESRPVPLAEAFESDIETFRAAIHRVGRGSSSSVAKELRALLELGCREFAMPLGLLTAMEGDHIRVVDVAGLSGIFDPDDVCGPGESFCSETLRSKRPLAIQHAGASKWREHAAYRQVGLESYLGSPIRIGGVMSGTLCFLDPEPRKEPFGPGDMERLRVLVERFEAILDFHEEERRLEGVLRRLSAPPPGEFFSTLAESLADALEVQNVYVGELVDESRRALRSIAFWRQSRLADPWDYGLDESPLANLSCESFYRCASGLGPQFPNDGLVRAFSADSYLGIPIVGGEKCLGYIIAFDTAPMRTRWFRDWTLRILAQLAGSEILRGRTERALQNAQKMEAVGHLTGGVAHDFNNLLAVICGNLELLSRNGAGDSPELEEIMRAASRGADLTERLLAFARKQPLNAEPTDVAQLVQGMHALIERTLGSAIDVRTKAPDEPLVALVDAGQAENAILNLAINGRDAMPGGGTLSVETHSLDAEQSKRFFDDESDAVSSIVISVRDTGSGMEGRVLERAFDPFFTTKSQGDGSGLGLSMVYGFAKQSGGTAHIESELGVGTTASLVLPRVDEHAVSAVREETIEAPRGHGETVLVVEDDESVRRYVISAVEALGYTPVPARDGEAARKVLSTRPVDALLSDVMLPGGLSGAELAREAMERGTGLRVILMSGYPSELETAELGGHVQFLGKPFRSSDLASALHRALADATESERPG